MNLIFDSKSFISTTLGEEIGIKQNKTTLLIWSPGKQSKLKHLENLQLFHCKKNILNAP